MADSPNASDWPVALVAMPFVTWQTPSIQIGLLTSIARSHGYPAEALHLYLDLVGRLGRDTYNQLCRIRRFQLGDWLFAKEAFGVLTPDPAGALASRVNAQSPEHLAAIGVTAEQLVRIRDVVIPEYLDALIEQIAWDRFKVVGFTTTFQQTVASIALARRLKEAWPDIVTVFGGANCDGRMGVELARSIASIDFAVGGEADQSFPRLLEALREGRPPVEIPGVTSGSTAQGYVAADPVRSLDALPIPDYSDFFARSKQLGLLDDASRLQIRVPFEGSRGCWWGVKQHCTFCGLNDETIGYRAKAADKVVEELTFHSRSYGVFAFNAVDNILNSKAFGNLLPVLSKFDFDIFFEIKANLKRSQIRELRVAGVRRVQPGIESFSSHVLRLMRKGTTGLQNINFLRWAQYYGLVPYWNILWGFPGERTEWVEEQAALLPLLRHLTPPQGASRIWLERFSPLFTDRELLPLRMRRANETYQFVYPPSVSIEDIAYMFDYEADCVLGDDVYATLSAAADDWRSAWRNSRPTLTFWHADGVLRIRDMRWPGGHADLTVTGLAADLYQLCSDEPRSVDALAKLTGASSETAASVLDGLIGATFMVRDEDRYLSLALPANPLR